MQYEFNLEEEVQRIAKRYQELAGQDKSHTSDEYLGFEVYQRIIDFAKDELISGRDHRVREGEQSYGDLPHSLYVFEIMMELVFSEGLNSGDVKVGMTTAFLHDIGYAAIAKEGADVTHEFQDLRQGHMDAGAVYVPEILSENFGECYSDDELKKIFDIIKVHDNPSVKRPDGGKGYPLDVNNKLLYMHRESDRMWMGSREGFDNDFRGRLESGETTPAKHIVWLEERYAKEKALYEDDGNFLGGLLFRTPKAFEIHQENMKAVRLRYNI